jgi:hypothetical protein
MAYPVLLIWADIKVVFFFFATKEKPFLLYQSYQWTTCV